MYMLRQGTGKPLLLVHGLGSSARNWDQPAQASELILAATG
jgi:pimeloyl-ACP methyl ester carboxylesterase